MWCARCFMHLAYPYFVFQQGCLAIPRLRYDLRGTLSLFPCGVCPFWSDMGVCEVWLMSGIVKIVGACVILMFTTYLDAEERPTDESNRLTFYGITLGSHSYAYRYTFPKPFRRFPDAMIFTDCNGLIYKIMLVARLTYTTKEEDDYIEVPDGNGRTMRLPCGKKGKNMEGEFKSEGHAQEFCQDETTRLVRLLEMKYKFGLCYKPGWIFKKFSQEANGYKFAISWSKKDPRKGFFDGLLDFDDTDFNAMYLWLEIIDVELYKKHRQRESEARNKKIKETTNSIIKGFKDAIKEIKEEREERIHKGEDDGFELL